MFLPDRYIKGECPKCGAKDQYGDACENCGTVYAPTDLKNPYSALSGAKPVLRKSEHYFFRLSDPEVVEFLRDWTSTDGKLAARGGEQDAEWLARTKAAASSPTGTSRATRPTSASRFRDAPTGQVLLRLARRADRLPRELEELLRHREGAQERRDAVLRRVPGRARRSSRYTSSARTSSTSTRCSGRRC